MAVIVYSAIQLISAASKAMAVLTSLTTKLLICLKDGHSQPIVN